MFFQIDDQLPVNTKIRKLIEHTMLGELDGLAALGLWSLAGAGSQASLTDGRISRPDLIRIVLNPELADRLAAFLVSVKLWHAPGHDCPRCSQPGEGEWLFHDWKDLGYNSAEQVKTTRRKRAELKDPNLIAAVWARDCIDPATPGTGKCRYCQEVLHRKTTVGDKKPTMDHVDPKKAIGIRNVVLACRVCNQHKGNRTPAEAGMTLHPAPRAALEPEPPPATTAATTAVDHRSKLSRATRAGAHGPWQGQGGVSGQGDQQGEAGLATGDAVPARQLSRSARRRARVRARREQEQKSRPEKGMDAGYHPPVEAPGTLGSPWHGWTGAPSPVTETTCPEHGEPDPCRKCQVGP